MALLKGNRLDKEILVFGRINCVACERVICDLLDEEVDYSYIDCDKPQEAAVRHNILGVPTIKIVSGTRTLHTEVGWNSHIKKRLLGAFRK